ncbi:hypothetical protein [Roseomonas xinghualingensis]|uniref:hypothetical protein n=1 Tax=Roseomonas xinghualingensis TaxID=2986475 RepID=UPI003671E362|nr:hypothetical protein [Roseomonas sp. SXEYE001]
MIAVLLATELPGASRVQQRAALLYQVRGRVVHAGHIPGPSDYIETVELARRVFLTLFSSTALPSGEDLLKDWRKLMASVSSSRDRISTDLRFPFREG